ncbi:MAG: LysR family transcriptional regulator [Acidobacteria bacterium]|nr:MAG: LysR family transcriptional regulator [Acidobacteriota bacterium]
MELRHLRYFVHVAEEQHYGRAAERLRVAQPALSRQIQDLEEEIGFKLFDRLPRGVKISAAGKSFLVDARRILHEVNEAAARAKRVASGQSGTLRVGFVESVSWHGVVPDSFREFRERQPDAELQLKPASSLEQTEAVHSGRMDAGFVFTIAHVGRELAQLPVASLNLMLAAPKGHPLTKLKKLRLRDLSDAAFVWFPRRESPAYYDRLMHECFRGGLKSPHIVQEAVNEATILSLVSCRLGVAFVSSATRWRCPESVALLPVTDLKLPLPFALVWRKDNASALLAKFVADVRSLPVAAFFPSETFRKISHNFSPAGVTSAFAALAIPTARDSVVSEPRLQSARRSNSADYHAPARCLILHHVLSWPDSRTDSYRGFSSPVCGQDPRFFSDRSGRGGDIAKQRNKSLGHGRVGKDGIT